METELYIYHWRNISGGVGWYPHHGGHDDAGAATAVLSQYRLFSQNATRLSLETKLVNPGSKQRSQGYGNAAIYAVITCNTMKISLHLLAQDGRLFLSLCYCLVWTRKGFWVKVDPVLLAQAASAERVASVRCTLSGR